MVSRCSYGYSKRREMMRFDGADYVPERDNARLTGQLLRIWNVMNDGRWRTLKEISALTGDPEASVSAQLRHLRKPRFGSYEIEREYIKNGLYRYKINMHDKSKELEL
jgi:hypothetical protein